MRDFTRNAKKILERIEKMKQQVKIIEMAYHTEVAKATLAWLETEKNIAELEAKISEISQKYGVDAISSRKRKSL